MVQLSSRICAEDAKIETHATNISKCKLDSLANGGQLHYMNNNICGSKLKSLKENKSEQEAK